MSAVKAFLIEPMAGTIRPVTINLEGSCAEIKRLVKCDMIDIVRLNGLESSSMTMGWTIPCRASRKLPARRRPSREIFS